MYTLQDFDEIRPYTSEEMPAIIEELIADPQFRAVVEYTHKGIPFEAIAEKMRSARTILEFQKAMCYPLVMNIMKTQAKDLSIDYSSLPGKDLSYTYISNHRDIILDSGLLSILLTDNGMDTVEIAIGDNLLIYPWIKKLVRLNKSFIVQRGLSPKEQLTSSVRMSRYMHFAITQKHQSIWIAQREGRCKDSNDRTQDSVLKMISMGREGDIIASLKEMNIVPLAISYEYDPCDYLKAKEFQLKRDNPQYRKTQQDDLENMQTGLFGYKGDVRFKTGRCLNEFLDTLDPKTPRKDIFRKAAEEMDRQIFASYTIYPGNYVALDMLRGNSDMAEHYSQEEAGKFGKYLQAQLDKIDIPGKDEAFLRRKILEMYANPLINQLENK